MRGRDQLHAFERLDAALRLARLGGLGAEAVDKLVQVGALALLLVEQRLLLGEAFAALALELGVAAAVEREALLFDVRDVADHGVEEDAVVGDQQQRAAVVAQPLFEPDDGVEIEVVGRLVEQQQIGAAHQRLRQVESHPPAAREVGHRPGEVGAREAQAVEQCGGTGAGAVALDLLQPAMEQTDALAVVGGFGGRQLGLDAAQFHIAVQGVVERTARQRRGLLRHMGDHPLRWQLAVALVGVKLAAQ